MPRTFQVVYSLFHEKCLTDWRTLSAPQEITKLLEVFDIIIKRLGVFLSLSCSSIIGRHGAMRCFAMSSYFNSVMSEEVLRGDEHAPRVSDRWDAWNEFIKMRETDARHRYELLGTSLLFSIRYKTVRTSVFHSLSLKSNSTYVRSILSLLFLVY
jgi:hypothetical protein